MKVTKIAIFTLVLCFVFGLTAMASIGVSVDPTVWKIKYTGGELAETATDYATITNTGSETVAIRVSGDDSRDWALVPDTTPPADSFSLQYYDATTSSWKSVKRGNQNLGSELAAGATRTTGFKIGIPGSSSEPVEPQHVYVSYAATSSAGYTYNPVGDFYYKCLGFAAYSSSWGSGSDREMFWFSQPGISLTCNLASGVGGNATSYSISRTDIVWALPYLTYTQMTTYATGASRSTTMVDAGFVLFRTNLSRASMIVTRSHLTSSQAGVSYRMTRWYAPSYVILE